MRGILLPQLVAVTSSRLDLVGKPQKQRTEVPCQVRLQRSSKPCSVVSPRRYSSMAFSASSSSTAAEDSRVWSQRDSATRFSNI